ncbi:DUF1765-domain-containing protein [Aulographum hederae CBS 113979]|uniref:DUF1765-domain-containing protein n=1 Tax=Aulographum hederae CBS 113979 TaxID=1176131 RepID=A0A6G1GSG6_9PEZI|nr:DUF1765-domain-containing protein [Aulographum hederae CBS 113979]
MSAIFSSSQHTEITQAPPVQPNTQSEAHLPKSFSLDRFPSFTASLSSRTSRASFLPTASERKPRVDMSRRRDELWTAFRTLDGEFQKFQSKSTALKANVVRSSLLPFLRTYALHKSDRSLRAEDLERRVGILNKWWQGLLELLHGQNNQSIFGTDRPTILDAIISIMERPEWRMALTQPVTATSTPPAGTPSRRFSGMPGISSRASSVSSTSSDFLTESVHHNTRVTFVQNLLAQMGFVVEKMSLRNAPASLVAFCGKTCAYAFFFCPGVADILVALWKPTMETLRRVLDECDVPRHAILGQVSKRICDAFPPCLHSLRFESLTQTMRDLQKRVIAPLGAERLQWFGPWKNRWSGRDSDLFYVFVKHYHILLTDYLPENPTKREKACAPGLIMVHAQILVNLDSTIHRHGSEEQSRGPSMMTFDDLLNADASAPVLLNAPRTNATRLMAEDRLIMLLRDFLSDRSTQSDKARRFFARSFNSILKAAASKTSLFNHKACYTLLDFLEEAITILVRYDQWNDANEETFDWDFWLVVWEKMMESENTTTEVRLYSFLFGAWTMIAADPARKKALSVSILLRPAFFQSRFNHWCPLVRAYYMRLITWRMSRYDEDEAHPDLEILQVLNERLHSVWSHYLYLKDDATKRNAMLPSTIPSNPAPARRLFIVRTDPTVAPNGGGTFFSFDNGLEGSPTSTALKRYSALPTPSATERPSSSPASDTSDTDERPGNKRWSILRNIVGSAKTRSPSPSPRPISRAPAEPASHEDRSNDNSPENTPRSFPTHRTFCFKFSLELLDKRHQNTRHLRLQPPQLPEPAQSLLTAEENQRDSVLDVGPIKPIGPAINSSRYAGRALAEWTIVVNEFESFVQRRMSEGVPSKKMVETPTLGVETFRKPS